MPPFQSPLKKRTFSIIGSVDKKRDNQTRREGETRDERKGGTRKRKRTKKASLNSMRRERRVYSLSKCAKTTHLKDEKRIIGREKGGRWKEASTSDCSVSSWDATPDLGLDEALVSATTDTEVTVLTPVLTPRVGDLPELLTVLNTPADKLDGMATLEGARDVVVDTASVGHEVRVDTESNLKRTVLHDISLDLSLTLESVLLLALVLVSLPVKSSVASALVLTVGSDDLAGILTSSVRIALLRDNTSLGEVGPGTAGLTTVARTAAHEQVLGAGVDILGGKRNIDAIGNTLTVAHGLSSTKGPAGTAVLLVADLSHGCAFGPVGGRVEGLGDVTELRGRIDLLVPGEGTELGEVNTEQRLTLSLGHASELGLASTPGGLTSIDVTDEAVERGNGRGSKKKNSSNALHVCYNVK